ncbi:hypothetical protein TPHA_0F01890 [Tetrapisispora phaffii CBS 4417]|uniref:phosphatidylinositol-3,4,5-trisphosphate 3-phosphatase n=1 Tax=Tetrapisispora phaffii (strain ATCC 24235 / CBS 4417 / NBRC 1672 / NRRL Y-8282 / UCD 70-5) TaxID=1071381 RepID=G8BV89_TETPH|nr:hypothetical protein TPHA_0F01890 [Tetrapisispora phaffii CBS 4417]CCE63671.1 hypothetical protein TPHA_0F01890 [Tetrapisispora phaffii CBS 4417]
MKDSKNKTTSPVSLILKKCFTFPMNRSKQNSGHTLDISYILPNLIVCSYPANHYPKVFYRNSLPDLIDYLNTTHGYQRWKIYNIKGEHTKTDYSEEDVYEILDNDLNVKVNSLDFPGKFISNKEVGIIQKKECVLKKGWLDHCPPTFLRMQEIVDDIEAQLNKSEKNVAVVHCRMGKGRSGTIVIAYLMKILVCPLSEAKDIFQNARFKIGISKGVTIRSQLRYLTYHELFLNYDMSKRKILLEILKNKENLFHFQLSSIELINPNSIIIPPKSINLVTIKVQTYNMDMNDLIQLNSSAKLEDGWKLDIYKKNSKYSGYDAYNNRRLIIHCPLDIPYDVSDIRIIFGINNNCNHKGNNEKLKNNSNSNDFESFNYNISSDKDSISNVITNSVTNRTSYSRVWFNLYWESLKCLQALSQTNFQIEQLLYEQFLGREFHMKINWNELDGPKGTNKKGIKLFDMAIIKWKIKQ